MVAKQGLHFYLVEIKKIDNHEIEAFRNELICFLHSENFTDLNDPNARTTFVINS